MGNYNVCVNMLSEYLWSKACMLQGSGLGGRLSDGQSTPPERSILLKYKIKYNEEKRDRISRGFFFKVRAPRMKNIWMSV